MLNLDPTNPFGCFNSEHTLNFHFFSVVQYVCGDVVEWGLCITLWLVGTVNLLTCIIDIRSKD